MARNDYWEKVMLKNIEKQDSIGLGVIATGIGGNEPLIDVSHLEKNLDLAQKTKTKSVTIFRLGGLDKNLASLLKKYSTS